MLVSGRQTSALSLCVNSGIRDNDFMLAEIRQTLGSRKGEPKGARIGINIGLNIGINDTQKQIL